MIEEREPKPKDMNEELRAEADDNVPEQQKNIDMQFKDALRFTSDKFDIELYSNRSDTRGLATVLMRLLKWMPRIEDKKKKIAKYVG